MTWFKIDDGFADHPKVEAAGNAAVGLWVRCGAWSSRYLTEGVIPTNRARVYGTQREITALTDVGLWVPDGAGSLVIPDFLEFNPSREQVEHDRAAARERQRLARERRDERRRRERGE